MFWPVLSEFVIFPAAFHPVSLDFSRDIGLGKWVDVEGCHSPTRYHRYTQLVSYALFLTEPAWLLGSA